MRVLLVFKFIYCCVNHQLTLLIKQWKNITIYYEVKIIQFVKTTILYNL